MSHKTGYGLPRTPQALRVLPLVPRIVAEGWSSGKLAREAGIDPSTAARYLRKIASKSDERAERETGLATVDSRVIAQRVQASKIARAEKLEELIGEALEQLDDGFLKTHYDKESGWVEKRYDYDASGKAKLLLDILRADKEQTALVKELSGIALAEKVALARIKGDATGTAIAAAVNAAHAELEGDVWEAETIPLDEESNGET